MTISSSYKISFIIYNLLGAIAALGLIAVYIIGDSDLFILDMIFLSRYTAFLFGICCILFTVMWSYMLFDKCIKNKELSKTRCVWVNLAVSFFAFIFAIGVISIFMAHDMSDDMAHNMPFAFIVISIWIFNAIVGLGLGGLLIFPLSVAVVLLWRYHVLKKCT